MSQEQLKIQDIQNGKILEIANGELQKCYTDMMNFENDRYEHRVVTIKIKLEPDKKEPDRIDIDCKVSTKLASPKAIKAVATVVKKGKEIISYEEDVQSELPDDDSVGLSVVEK